MNGQTDLVLVPLKDVVILRCNCQVQTVNANGTTHQVQKHTQDCRYSMFNREKEASDPNQYKRISIHQIESPDTDDETNCKHQNYATARLANQQDTIFFPKRLGNQKQSFQRQLKVITQKSSTQDNKLIYRTPIKGWYHVSSTKRDDSRVKSRFKQPDQHFSIDIDSYTKRKIKAAVNPKFGPKQTEALKLRKQLTHQQRLMKGVLNQIYRDSYKLPTESSQKQMSLGLKRDSLFERQRPSTHENFHTQRSHHRHESLPKERSDLRRMGSSQSIDRVPMSIMEIYGENHILGRTMEPKSRLQHLQNTINKRSPRGAAGQQLTASKMSSN